VRDNGEPLILDIKANCLQFLVHFYFRQAQVTVPVFVNDLHELQTWFVVLAFHVFVEVAIGKPKLSGLNAFVDGFLDFEDVDAALGAGAGKEVRVWVKYDAVYFGVTVASLQLLHDLSPVSTVDLYDLAPTWGRSYERPFRIYSHRTYFSVMRWNNKVNWFVNNIIQNFKGAFFCARQTNNLGNWFLSLG
jgi:hypothetical protein